MAVLSAPPQLLQSATRSAPSSEDVRVVQNSHGEYEYANGRIRYKPSPRQVEDVVRRLSLKDKMTQARAQRNSKYNPIPRRARGVRHPSNLQLRDEISEVTSLLSKADIGGSSYLKESAPQSREASEDEGDMDEDDAVDDSGESADDEDDAEEAGEADEEAEEQSGDEDAMDGSGDEDEDDEDERVPQCADVDVEDESEEEGEDCTKDQEAAATNVEGTDDREDEDDGAANSPNYELASAEAEHDSGRQCRDRSPTPHPSRSVDDARDEHPSWQLGDGELPDFEEVEKEAEAKEREQEACVKLVEQLIEEVASNPSSSPTQHAVQPPHEAEDTLPVPDESQNEDPTLDHPSLAATPATPGPHDERSPSPEVTSEQFAEWVGPSSSDEENEEDQPIQPENVAATVDEQQELPAPAPSPSSSSRAPAESTTGSEVTEISPCTFPPLDTAPSSHEPDTMIVEPAAAAATATPIHDFELSTSTFSTSLPSSFSSWLSPSLPASLAYPLPCPFPSSSPLPSSLPSSPPSSSLFPSSFSPSSSSFTTPPPVVSAFPTQVPDVAHSIHVVGSLPSAPALSATPATVFPDEQMEVDDTSVPMEITPPPLPEHQLSRYSNQGSFKLKAGGRQAQRNPRLRLSVLKQNQSRNRKAASTRTAGDGRLPLRLRRHNSQHWLDRTFVILMAIVVSRQRRLRKTISDRALRAQVARLAHQTRQSFAGRRTCAQQEPTMVVDCLLLVDEDIDMDNAVVDHDIAIPETTQSTAQAAPFVAPAVPLLPSVSHTTREIKLSTAYSNAPAATVPTATIPAATTSAPTTSAPASPVPTSPVPTSPVHISSAPTATVATASATNAPATTESLATETSLHSSATTSLDLQPQADESTIGPIAPTAVADESVGITAVGVSDIALVVPPPIVATQGPSIEFVIEGDISGSDEDDEETDYSSSSTSYSSSSSSASSYSSTSPFSYARAPLSTPPTSNLTPVAASVRGSEHTEYATAVSFSAKKPPVQRVDGRVSGTGEHTHPIVTKAVTSRYSSLANALGNYPSAPAPPAPLSVPSAQPVKTGVWTPAASLPSASSSAQPTRPHQVSLAERCAFMSGSGPGGMTPSQKKVARLKQLQEEKRKRQAIIAVAEASYDLKNAPDPAPASSPPATTSAPLLEDPCPNTNAEERAVRGGCISPAVNAEAPLVLGSSNSTIQGDIPVTVPETDDESVPSIARPDTSDVHYDQPGEQTGFEDMHTQVDQRPPSGITDEPQLSSSASSKGKAKMSDEEAEAYYRAQRVESSYMARAMSPIPQEFPAHTHSTVEQSVREHPLAQLHGLSDDEIEWNAMVFGPNQWSDGVSDPSVSQHVPDLQDDEEYSTTGDGNAPEQVRSESLGAQNGRAAFEEHTLSLATCIPAIHVVPPSPDMSAQDMSKSASLWSSASSGSTVLPTSPEPAGVPLKQPKNRRVSQSTAKRMKQRMVSRSAVPTSMSEPRPSLLDSFAFQSIGTQDPITGHLDSIAPAHTQASEGSFSSDMFGAAMDGLPNSTFNAVFASMQEFLRPFDNDGSGQSAQATSPPSPPEVVGTINSLFEAEASQYSERVNDGAIPSATDPLSQLADVAALMSYASSLSNVPDSSADGFQTGSLWAEGMLVDPEVVTGGSPAPIESIGDVPMSDGSVQAQRIPPPFEGFEVYAEDPLSPSLIFAQTFDEPIFDEQLTQHVPEVEPIAVAEMSVPVTSEAHPIPLPLAEVTTTEPQRVGPEALSEAEGEAEPVLSPVVSEESSAEDLPSEPPGDHPEQASQSQPAVIEDDHAQSAPTQDGVATATISPYTPLVKRERPEGLVHRLHGTSAVPRSFFSAGGPYRYMSLDMPVRCRARQKTRSARGQVPRFLRSLPSPQLSRASSPDASTPGAAEAAEDVPSPPRETEEEPRSPLPPPSARPPRPPSPPPALSPPAPSDRPSRPLPRRPAHPPALPSPASRPAPRPAPRRRAPAPAPAPSHEPETYWHRRMRTGFAPKAFRAEAKASTPPSSPSSSPSSSSSSSASSPYPSRPPSPASDATDGPSDPPSESCPASPVSSDPSSTDSASSDEGEGEGEGEDVDDPFPGSFPCGPGSERESASERENAVKFALALIACVAFQIVYSAA